MGRSEHRQARVFEERKVMTETQDIIGIDQAATLLGMSEKSIRRHLKEIPHRRMHGRSNAEAPTVEKCVLLWVVLLSRVRACYG